MTYATVPWEIGEFLTSNKYFSKTALRSSSAFLQPAWVDANVVHVFLFLLRTILCSRLVRPSGKRLCHTQIEVYRTAFMCNRHVETYNIHILASNHVKELGGFFWPALACCQFFSIIQHCKEWCFKGFAKIMFIKARDTVQCARDRGNKFGGKISTYITFLIFYLFMLSIDYIKM